MKVNKMHIEAFKNSKFKDECAYLEPKVPDNINNDNNKLDMNKENINCNKVNCRKNRRKEIWWVHPRFCKLFNINIGKYFF